MLFGCGVNGLENIVIELILASFDRPHTALLARAALARLQQDEMSEAHDFAIVSWKEGENPSMQESIDLFANRKGMDTFWRKLVELLSVASREGVADGSAESDRLSAIGISDSFLNEVKMAIRPGGSVLLVLTTDETQSRVQGVISGFSGTMHFARLIGDDREAWLKDLSR